MLVNLMPKVMFEADGGAAAGNGDAGQTAATEPKTEPKTEPAKQEPKHDENMIPKSRFDEINSKYKELADKVEAYEKQQSEAERKAKEEQGKFEELYQTTQKELDNYKQYENRAKELEGMIEGMVKTKLESVPEDFHDIVPTNLSAEQTLDWLNKAETKGLFGKKEPEVKEVGNSRNDNNQEPKIKTEGLSPLDKILSGLGR